MDKRDGVAESVVAVSCPGGIARQYRVQVASGETSSSWQLVGSFREESQAGECASKLKLAGKQTRIVACIALPTAA